MKEIDREFVNWERFPWADRNEKIYEINASKQLRMTYGKLKNGSHAIDLRIWIKGAELGIPTDGFVDSDQGIFLISKSAEEMKSLLRVLDFTISAIRKAEKEKTKK